MPRITKNRSKSRCRTSGIFQVTVTIVLGICCAVFLNVFVLNRGAYDSSTLLMAPANLETKSVGNSGSMTATSSSQQEFIPLAAITNDQQQNGEILVRSAEEKWPTQDESSAMMNNHKVAGLSCREFRGPAASVSNEMVYWKDIPKDANFESPYKRVGPEVKYLTFEPDEGGWVSRIGMVLSLVFVRPLIFCGIKLWAHKMYNTSPYLIFKQNQKQNNIRMAMETAVTMALAMGRTLVIPPEQQLYLLQKKDGGQKNRFTFKDFFHFDSVELEHKALEVITLEEFLKREAITGNMRDKKTGEVSYPPNNRVNWNGQANYESHKQGIFPWLRTVTKTIDWNWEKCIAGFPKEPGEAGAQNLKAIFEEAKSKMSGEWRQRVNQYSGNPTPVDASAADRMLELLSSRGELCLYDTSYQEAKYVHAMGDNDSGARMLAHFYSFLFYEDWHHDLWTKRFVRDHLRYIDELQCHAAKVVNFLRLKAQTFGDPNGEFYTMHIRRGDFQYKDTRIPAEQIFENARDVIPEGATVYIATDEKVRSFFDIFAKHYKIYFLDSNPPLIEGLNSNYYGMLDQLIASRGKVFVGTFYSTFTGYINRLRGYHTQKTKQPGYETGNLESYFYVPMDKKHSMRTYQSVHPLYWAREFPIGWRDIDKDVDESSVAGGMTPLQ